MGDEPGERWGGVRELMASTPFDTISTVLAHRAESDPLGAPFLLSTAAWCAVIRDDLSDAAALAARARASTAQSVGSSAIIDATDALAMMIDAFRGTAPIDHDALDGLIAVIATTASTGSSSTDGIELEQFAWSTEMANWYTFADRYRDAAQLLDRRLGSGDASLDSFEVISALCCRAELDIRRGRWTRAAKDLDDAIARSQSEGHAAAYAQALAARIAAGRGNREQCRQHIVEAWSSSTERGDRSTQWRVVSAEGFAAVSAREFESARSLLSPLRDQVDRTELHLASVRLWEGDLIDALIHLDERSEAERVLKWMTVELDRVPSRWGRAVVSRGEALLEPDAAIADQLAQESTAMFEVIGAVFEAARSRLVRSELLARHGERSESRALATTASLTFQALGASAWDERAQLAARTGSRPDGSRHSSRDRRSALELDGLTPQELAVALAVSRGSSNKEISTELHASVKTVETHLTRVYRKLGVRSRSELIARYLGGRDD